MTDTKSQQHEVSREVKGIYFHKYLEIRCLFSVMIPASKVSQV